MTSYLFLHGAYLFSVRHFLHDVASLVDRPYVESAVAVEVDDGSGFGKEAVSVCRYDSDPVPRPPALSNELALFEADSRQGCGVSIVLIFIALLQGVDLLKHKLGFRLFGFSYDGLKTGQCEENEYADDDKYYHELDHGETGGVVETVFDFHINT